MDLFPIPDLRLLCCSARIELWIQGYTEYHKHSCKFNSVRSQDISPPDPRLTKLCNFPLNTGLLASNIGYKDKFNSIRCFQKTLALRFLDLKAAKNICDKKSSPCKPQPSPGHDSSCRHLVPYFVFLSFSAEKSLIISMMRKKYNCHVDKKKTLIAVFVHSRFHIIFFVYFAVEIVHLSASKCACGVLECACGVCVSKFVCASELKQESVNLLLKYAFLCFGLKRQISCRHSVYCCCCSYFIFFDKKHKNHDHCFFIPISKDLLPWP